MSPYIIDNQLFKTKGQKMTTITLGGDQPTEATIDQNQFSSEQSITVQTRAVDTHLTITNTEGSSKPLWIIQEASMPEDSPVNSVVTLGENTQVTLIGMRNFIDGNPDIQYYYKLSEGARLDVSLEASYDRNNPTLNIDMGKDVASTLTYSHEPRYYDMVPLSLTGVTENDQIIVNGASRMTYINGELNFYGYDEEGVREELFATMSVEGLDPDKFNFEDGTLTYTCYLKGTHIATPEGEVKVEDLKAGDKVNTASGDINTVKWIGFRKLNRFQLPTEHALRASPIRICNGAFAENVPHRDLTVSPGHRFNFDGALVPALSLVNGLTITQDFDVQQFEYYHIELEKFDMLLAEGAAAESYLEVGSNRHSFQNARTVTAHPDFGPAPKTVVLTEYVQKITPEIIEPIRRDLFKRAEILTGAVRTADTDLRIEINGQVIKPQTACKRKGLYRFELPADPRGDIRILSNTAVVRETSLMVRTDTRIIGVGLSGVALITNDQHCEIDLIGSALDGLNETQEVEKIMMRWTTGEAVIPASLVPTSKGPFELELNVFRTHMYWRHDEPQLSELAA